MKKVLYEELCPAEFQERIKEMPIAYLPLGTLEWHGPHMPLGADGIQAQELFVKVAEELGGIVLPKLFMGPDRYFDDWGKEYYGMDISTEGTLLPYHTQKMPGSAYWMEMDLFKTMLMSIFAQLSRAGFKVVIGHGHGPSVNAFNSLAEEAREKFGLRLYNCWSFADDERLKYQNDHAAANETSIVMAVRPELVQFDRVEADGSNLVGVAGRHPMKESSAEYGQEIITYTMERLADGIRRECAELF